ncbi:UNVERIFIED_CONTAM: hypothetical protein GTU68_014831 [Idotea baltica]|nr:hypothetical protein [Idotea baltica]
MERISIQAICMRHFTTCKHSFGWQVT